MRKERMHYSVDEKVKMLMAAGISEFEALKLARMLEEYPFHFLELIAAGIKKMARGKDQT